MEINICIGERLKEVREALALSQTEFAQIAERAGVPGATRQSQAKYEKGLATPGATYLAAISAAGADTNYILTGQRSQPPSHERLEIALATVGLSTAEAAAKALKVSLKDMRGMLAGKQPLNEALHEPLRKLGVDVRYVLEGDGGDRSQADLALNPAEAKLLRDYRASYVDVQAALCAAAQAGAAANKKL